MARFQPTSIERLGEEAEHYVELRLDAERRGQVTLAGICAEIKAKFGAAIPLSTLSSYKQKRYLRRLDRLQIQKDFLDVAEQRLKDKDLSKSTQAELLDLFDEAMRAGAKLDPHFVMSERRKWAELGFKHEQLEQAKKLLELKVSQLEQQQKNAKEEIEQAGQKLGKGESLTIEDINRIRERVFGLTPVGGEPQAPAGDPA